MRTSIKSPTQQPSTHSLFFFNTSQSRCLFSPTPIYPHLHPFLWLTFTSTKLCSVQGHLLPESITWVSSRAILIQSRSAIQWEIHCIFKAPISSAGRGEQASFVWYPSLLPPHGPPNYNHKLRRSLLLLGDARQLLW